MIKSAIVKDLIPFSIPLGFDAGLLAFLSQFACRGLTPELSTGARQEAMQETLGDPQPSSVPFPTLPQADGAVGVSSTGSGDETRPAAMNRAFVQIPTKLPMRK